MGKRFTTQISNDEGGGEGISGADRIDDIDMSDGLGDDFIRSDDLAAVGALGQDDQPEAV